MTYWNVQIKRKRNKERKRERENEREREKLKEIKRWKETQMNLKLETTSAAISIKDSFPSIWMYLTMDLL